MMVARTQQERLYVSDEVPLPSDLEEGQLAVNLADGRLYTKNAAGDVISVGKDVFLADLTVEERTNSFVLTPGDKGKMLVVQDDNNLPVTVFADNSLPVGYSVSFYQRTIQQVWFHNDSNNAGDPGIALRAYQGADSMSGQYAVCTLTRLTDDEWTIAGETSFMGEPEYEFPEPPDPGYDPQQLSKGIAFFEQANYTNDGGMVSGLSVSAPDGPTLTASWWMEAPDISTSNLCQWSENLGNSVWDKTNGVTLDADVTSPLAPDGEQTADRLVDNTSALGLVRQYIPIPANDGDQYTFSCFLARDSDQTRMPELWASVTGNGANIQINTQTGAFDARPGAVPDAMAVVAHDANWWRVSGVITNIGGDATIRIGAIPAATSTLGTATEPALTGSAVFWGFQLEPGNTLGAYERNPVAVPDTQCIIQSDANNRFRATVLNGNQLEIEGRTDAGTRILHMQTNPDSGQWYYLPNFIYGQWAHCCLSVDTANPANSRLYISGNDWTADLLINNVTAGDLGFTWNDVRLGSSSTADNAALTVQEGYLKPNLFMDLDSEIGSFIDLTSGDPKNLLSLDPDDDPPEQGLVFFHGQYETDIYLQNFGTAGGIWAAQQPIEEAATKPSCVILDPPTTDPGNPDLPPPDQPDDTFEFGLSIPNADVVTLNGRTLSQGTANITVLSGRVYDLRGKVIESSYYNNDLVYSGPKSARGYKFNSSGLSSAYSILGGLWIGRNDHYNGWGAKVDQKNACGSDHGLQSQDIFTEGGGDIRLDGCRVHNVQDGFRHDFPSGQSTNNRVWHMRNCWFSNVRDDCLEMERSMAVGSIEDCLFDGCYVFASYQGSGTTGTGNLIIRNSLVWMRRLPFPRRYWYKEACKSNNYSTLQPWPLNKHWPVDFPSGETDNDKGTWGNGRLFKWQSSAPNIEVYDSTFYFEFWGAHHFGVSSWEGKAAEWYGFPGNFTSKLKGASGNTILWGGPGNFPGTINSSYLSGFTIKNWDTDGGAAVSNEFFDKRAQWIANHPQVMRLGTDEQNQDTNPYGWEDVITYPDTRTGGKYIGYPQTKTTAPYS